MQCLERDRGVLLAQLSGSKKAAWGNAETRLQAKVEFDTLQFTSSVTLDELLGFS